MSQAHRADLQQFLSVLWPAPLDAAHWLLFWGTPSKRSEWVQAITPDVLDRLEHWAEKENVYFGCGLRTQNFGPTLRGERADVVGLPGVWLDIDYGLDHKKPNLPPTEEDALQLVKDMGPPPTLLMHSGRGLQAWWGFREPWIFADEEDRMKAERLTKAWCTTLRVRARAKGWDADQVGDLPRVMRLPGLWNRKGVPKRTRLLSADGALRYNPGELELFLAADLDAKDTVPNLKWSYQLSPSAEPPADKFATLYEIDHLFKASWLHARTDLQDQSTSSYDLSLATRAFAAHWSEQEVVNLLIAHRRKHKADPEKSLRKDYFDRTLDRAISGKDQVAREEAIESLKAGKTTPPKEGPIDKAENLAICSDIIGVSFTKFVRFVGGSNTYQLMVNGRKIDVPNITIFDSQAEFRRLILDYTDKRIDTMKAGVWNQFVNLLFKAIEDVVVAVDATREGAYANWVDYYLSSETIASDKDWKTAALANQPFIREGVQYFVALGFLDFLKNRMQEKITIQRLTEELTKFGYGYERIHLPDARRGRHTKTTRSCWKLLDIPLTPPLTPKSDPHGA
jgi:hypothetical protein